MKGRLNLKKTEPRKYFFKPETRKFVIVFLLFLFTGFLGVIASETEIEFLDVIERIFSPHYFIYEAISLFYGDGWTLFAVLLVILAFLTGFLYWYLISCLIIFLYEKLKGKK